MFFKSLQNIFLIQLLLGFNSTFNSEIILQWGQIGLGSNSLVVKVYEEERKGERIGGEGGVLFENGALVEAFTCMIT